LVWSGVSCFGSGVSRNCLDFLRMKRFWIAGRGFSELDLIFGSNFKQILYLGEVLNGQGASDTS
jgi:hypothetical protein